MAPKVGHKMKMYRNTGSVAVPVWVEVDEVGDVTISDFAMGIAELKRRANDFTKNLASLIQSISIEFRLHHGLGATNFDAIRTNFLAGTAEEWAILDGGSAVSGTEGLRLPVLIEQFPWDQALEDVSGHDVRLAIAYMEESSVEIDPSWMVVP